MLTIADDRATVRRGGGTEGPPVCAVSLVDVYHHPHGVYVFKELHPTNLKS